MDFNHNGNLIEEAQNFFNWSLEKVKAESVDLGDAVANMLTLLSNSNLQGGAWLGPRRDRPVEGAHLSDFHSGRWPAVRLQTRM